MLKLLLLIFCCSCSFLPFQRPVEDPVKVPDRWEGALNRASLYENLMVDHQDDSGFIYSKWCDSLTFSALLASVGVLVDVLDAREGLKWYRRPSKDCYEKGESGSECSRDGYLSVIIWAFYTNQAQILEDIATYGKEVDWYMCEWVNGKNVLSPAYFNPHMRMILLKAYKGLTGKDLDVGVASWGWTSGEGYKARLFMDQVSLLLDIDGQIPGEAFEILKGHYLRNPNNPHYEFVYQKATSKDYSRTVNLLLGIWPEGRLPNNTDFCDEWVVQREPGKDWESCDRKRTHVGGPFVYIVKNIQRELRK